MRVKISIASPEATLTRVLEALERELIEASDEEIIAAASDLGMDPKMKGSAAFMGLKHPATHRLADFFDMLSALPKDDAQQIRLMKAFKHIPKK